MPKFFAYNSVFCAPKSDQTGECCRSTWASLNCRNLERAAQGVAHVKQKILSKCEIFTVRGPIPCPSTNRHLMCHRELQLYDELEKEYKILCGCCWRTFWTLTTTEGVLQLLIVSKLESMCTLGRHKSAPTLNLTPTLTLDLLNPWFLSVKGFDKVLRTSTVPSFKSLWSGVFVLLC